MAIDRVEIKDFLVFRDEFKMDFCPGVNVLIGGNGTGKTTLLKAAYRLCGSAKNRWTEEYFFAEGRFTGSFVNRPFEYLKMQATIDDAKTRICIRSLFQNLADEEESGVSSGNKIIDNGEWVSYHPDEYKDDFTQAKAEMIIGDLQDELVFRSPNYTVIPTVFIPATNLLTHSRGLVEMIDGYEMDFDATQIDILKYAQRPATRTPKPNCAKVIGKLGSIIGGEVLYDNGCFYIKKNSGMDVEFAIEASGFVRLGLLWKLLRNGLLERGSILFWDEPENSLNPEHVPKLVDILLELSRNGVQIFIATHSELLSGYFAVTRQKGDTVMFYSLYKDGEKICADVSDRFELLEPNNLTAEPVKLYEKEIERGLGNG